MKEIVYRDLALLKPNEKNPRKGTEKAIRELADSIKNNPDFFEARPILLSNRTGELVIIGGERRSEAAKLLGMDEVPTILIEGLTEQQEDEIMIKDNTHSGEWVEAMLHKWDKEKLKGWGVEVPNWDDNEVSPDEFGENFALPNGGKSPVSQITFTLSNEQAEYIKEALKNVKETEEYKNIETFGNTNSNGNAIYTIVSLWENARIS